MTRDCIRWDWKAELTHRQRKEVRFSHTYHQFYDHGTVGHSLHTLIALMALKLDAYELALNQARTPPEPDPDPDTEAQE